MITKDTKYLDLYNKTKGHKIKVRFETIKLNQYYYNAISETHDKVDELDDIITFIDNNPFLCFPLSTVYNADTKLYRTFWKIQSQIQPILEPEPSQMKVNPPKTIDFTFYLELQAKFDTLAELSKAHTKKLNKVTSYIYGILVDLDNKSEWGICDKSKDELLNKIYDLLIEETEIR